MALEIIKAPRRSFDAPRDKPRVDRGEHANLERPGAVLHPHARAARAPTRGGWARYLNRPTGWC